MATFLVNPKPFLNDLTGKHVIVKQKWKVVRVKRWKNVLQIRRVPEEDDAAENEVPKDKGKIFPREDVPSRRRSERETRKNLKVTDVDMPHPPSMHLSSMPAT